MKGETKMKTVKMMADKFTKLAEIAAKSAAGSASWCNVHQPKEPANIMEKLSKK